MATKIDLTGKTFGRLTVLKEVEQGKDGHSYWLCSCECGNTKNVQGKLLRSSNTRSCGCFRKDSLRKIPGEANWHSLFCQYKANSKRRGYEFNLNKENFINLAKANCYYCGSSPTQKLKTYEASQNTKEWRDKCIIFYNGIDRINNDLGYINENVVSCCKNCNRAKSKLTKDEFFELIKKIYEKHCK